MCNIPIQIAPHRLFLYFKHIGGYGGSGIDDGYMAVIAFGIVSQRSPGHKTRYLPVALVVSNTSVALCVFKDFRSDLVQMGTSVMC